jgi:hypothetical protein
MNAAMDRGIAAYRARIERRESNMTHTKGPWRVEQRKHQNLILHSAGDGYQNRVALTVEWFLGDNVRPNAEQADANACRIVACVNALESFDIAAIEAGVVKELVDAAKALSPVAAKCQQLTRLDAALALIAPAQELQEQL